MGVCRYLWRPEEGIRSLGAGGPGQCDLPVMDAGNQSLILNKIILVEVSCSGFPMKSEPQGAKTSSCCLA